jgi:hypothetical protein
MHAFAVTKPTEIPVACSLAKLRRAVYLIRFREIDPERISAHQTEARKLLVFYTVCDHIRP